MLVNSTSQRQPDLPLPLVTTNNPQPSGSRVTRSEQLLSPPPDPVLTVPFVPSIRPGDANGYVFGKPASAQDGFLTQHNALSGQIGWLISQQPTYEDFLEKYKYYIRENPDEVGKIGTLYANFVSQFWTSSNSVQTDSKPPQEQLVLLHRKMLSTQASLRAADGTLSTKAQGLINNALRYPTLSARENALPHGARFGVYPITVDGNTPGGARLAGSFMITSSDGSVSTQPHWPDSDKRLFVDDKHGPVVLYTPGEGFEEFATPAQMQATLMKRIDAGGVPAELLSQSLPLSVENLLKPVRGEDLTLSFTPSQGDVIAEAVPQLLTRQKDELEALMKSDTSDLNSLQILGVMNNAADWTFQFDGANAMLARGQMLEDKQQPQWLKSLSPMNEGQYQYLDTQEQQSRDALVPLLEKIPSLQGFTNLKLTAALRKKYPDVNFDPEKIIVTTTTQSIVHTGVRHGAYNPRNVTRANGSLSDFALKNPTVWPAAQSHQHQSVTMSANLTDASGKPVIGDDGRPVVLQSDELKSLVNELDVGGNYIKLLEEKMAPDAVTGEPGALRSAWKANLSDVMSKQAFLGELNPSAYP